MRQASEQDGRRLDFQTTYRHGQVLVWHDCGKNVHVPDGKVSSDIYDRHVCGPAGTPWDRSTSWS